jgi:AraC-like DNA-binding protein
MAALTNSECIYRDTEELPASLSHANVRAMQMDRGKFEATIQRFQIRQLSFQYLQFISGTSTCSGDATNDRYVFLIPLNGTRGSRLLGHDLEPNGVSVYAPGSEHGDVTKAGLSEAMLALPSQMLSGLEDRGDLINLPRRNSEYRTLEPEKLNALRRTLWQVQALATEPDLPGTVARTVVDRLTLDLLDAFGPSGTDVGVGRTPMPRRPILRRISEEIDRRHSELLLASELAAIVGVSLPTLQRVFLEWYGVPPARYLTLRRFYLARAKLRSGLHGSVGEVAQECGFFELSRFAKRYRALFGELPSQTLRSRNR